MRVDPTIFPFVARCYSKWSATAWLWSDPTQTEKALSAMQQYQMFAYHLPTKPRQFKEDPLRLVNVFLYSACVHFLRCTRCTWLFQSSHGRILGGDWGDLKQAKSIFIHPNFLQFGKQHSRYKPILSSFVLSQQCCEVYFISLAAVNPWRNETWMRNFDEIAPRKLTG